MNRYTLLTFSALAVGCTSTPAMPGSSTTAHDASSPWSVDAWVAASDHTSGTSGDAGSAALASLTVSPLALTPSFSPTIHDYYVRCASGENAVTVTMSAATGAKAALLQPITTPPAASGSAGFNITQNQAIVVAATSGGASAQYWVRCLPSNFPVLEMELHADPSAVTPGYYLVGDVGAEVGHGPYAMVLDTNGVPVWYAKTLTGKGPANVESLATDDISYVGWLTPTFSSTSGKYEIHGLSPAAITYTEPVDAPLNPHELQRLSNGHYLLLSWPITTGVDLTGLESFGANEDIINCNVQEIDATGAEVWSWVGTDHLDPVKDSTWPQTVVVAGTTVVDPFHCNAIDVNENGDLLISARHMDAVFLITKATGKIAWKLGGASDTTKDNAVYLAVSQDPKTSFYRQHDARFLPNNQISLFDDQTAMPGPARAAIYSYDTSAQSATFVWEANGTISSAAMGSFRMAADGSRIIGWGEGNVKGRVFTEVNAAGADILDFYFVAGDYSYRAIKVPLSQLDLGLMRASVSSEGSPDAGSTRVPDDGATGGTDGGVDAGMPPTSGCSTVTGTGSSATCTYTSIATDAGCPADAGATQGSCPSTNLYGCCVETSALDGGGDQISAACYYSSTNGQPAYSQCALETYDGLPYTWQTTAP